MSKKYEFTDATMVVEGVTVYRIRFLRDVQVGGVTIPAGFLGGFLESEDNLPHENESVVLDNAVVMGQARVRYHAIVEGRAIVKDEAEVSGYARVSGYSYIQDTSRIVGTAKVNEYAKISGSSVIAGLSYVNGSPKIHSSELKDSEVHNKVTITDSSVYHGLILGNVSIINSSLLGEGLTMESEAQILNTRVSDSSSNIFIGGTTLISYVFFNGANRVKILDNAKVIGNEENEIMILGNHIDILNETSLTSTENGRVILSGNNITLTDFASITGAVKLFYDVTLKDFVKILNPFETEIDYKEVDFFGDTEIITQSAY